MPIRAYLDGQWFDGGHRFDDVKIRLMGIAFEMALASLGATRCHDDPVRAALAHTAGERDAERLCEAALSNWEINL